MRQVGRYNSQLRKLAKAVKTHKELFGTDPFHPPPRPRKVVVDKLDTAPKELTKVRRIAGLPICCRLRASESPTARTDRRRTRLAERRPLSAGELMCGAVRCGSRRGIAIGMMGCIRAGIQHGVPSNGMSPLVG